MTLPLLPKSSGWKEITMNEIGKYKGKMMAQTFTVEQMRELRLESYRAGQKHMREKASNVCEERAKLPANDSWEAGCRYAEEDCRSLILALPIEDL